ncbi:MAG TPA: hypothetical protein VLB74_09405 [Flavobacterium sp.]|uniref:hypothetical protein n=1 Tax=Flavobacterium sp. TaxID=239 RepID=UPI002BE2E0BF|nr:hypothetical protein [Flavobacterium sp.]HSD14850.1 hypothetical protein [Flavobacterium sp.]
MKKLITLFVLFLAFSINASAQDKPVGPEVRAKKDLEQLMQVVQPDNNMQVALFNLFIKKYQELDAPNMTPARRLEITSMMDAKLRASLTNDQIIALEKSNDLYSHLIAKVPAETTTAKKKK